ncbi:radical SAM protein [Rhizobium leguminosarum]|uniref:Radical SAM core domain-containing protein n=1 Tax=Rhizobium leguminosarum TaxID=384 RepID=A0A1B1CHR3_RHILE|nr:radical SAM protein [Rhizobium leguminosarum]ANP89310.1 hypothetical protein BA011_26435 [Rhizobium leguminosarum]
MTVLQPRQLTVLTTSQCTASCGHCSMNSSPERRDRLTFETIRTTIDELHAKSPLAVVIFAGGEPTLMGETLLNAIAHADDLGIITRIVTNASWAISDAKAEAKIRELRQAGLGELNISADDFHLPWIPFENVARAWCAAKSRGFSSVVIANCYGPNSIVTPEYIMERLCERLPTRFDDQGKSEALPDPAADGTVYMLSNSFLQRLGRAHTTISDPDIIFPEHDGTLAGACPWAVRSAALSPQGRLVACCGMEAEHNRVLDFGVVRPGEVQGLIEQANRSVLVNAIALLGPYFVQQFIRARREDIPFRARYATVCEICEDLVSRKAATDAINEHIAELAVAVSLARVNLETSRMEVVIC